MARVRIKDILGNFISKFGFYFDFLIRRKCIFLLLMAMKACELVFVSVAVHLSKWRSLFRFLAFAALLDKCSNKIPRF